MGTDRGLSPTVTFFTLPALKLCLPAVLIHAVWSDPSRFFFNRISSWSQTTLYLFAIACAFALYIAYGVWFEMRQRQLAKSYGAVLPPAVRDPWPFGLGFLFTVLQYTDAHIGDWISHFSNELGSTIWAFRIGPGLTRYMTTEPKHLKTILATRFEDWEKGPVWRAQMDSVLGTGVFNSDGDMWKLHRTMTRPFFKKERVSNLDTLDACLTNAIAQAKGAMAAGHAVDFQDMVGRILLDNATAHFFDHNVHSLSAGLISSVDRQQSAAVNAHPASRFGCAFSDALLQLGYRTFTGSAWPLRELAGDRTAAHMRVINNFLQPLVEETLERKRNGELQSAQPSLLEELANATDDPKVIRDEILNIVIAGRDTVASTMTFAAYMLTQNPHVLEKLRHEVLSIVGHERPTTEDLKSMHYLRAFINETLRMYPPVPFNIRMSVRDTTLPATEPGAAPYFVPKGTQCAYSVLLMHRRTDFWGPDAGSFDPMRFLDARARKYLTPNPYIFLPFSAGPRICLGQQYAYTEMSFALARLLQAFDGFALARDMQMPPPAAWRARGGRQAQEEVWLRPHLTLYCKGGLWLRMRSVDAEPSH